MKRVLSTTTSHRPAWSPMAWSLAIACVAGCAFDTAAPPWSASGAQHSNADLEAGADRPPTQKTLYAMSRILAARGRDSECELLLRQVLEKSPDLLPAYCDLAALYLRHGRIDEAIETLTRGLRVAPEDPILQNNQGMCWMLRGENEDALRCFTGAATFAPQDARYRTNMAVILSMMGRYAEAQSLFEQVLPEKEARHNLDVIAGARHDSEHAIEEDRATRALDPATRSDAPVRPPDLPENLSHARSSRLEAILAKAGVAMSGPRPEAEVGLDILPNADSVRKEH